MIREDKSYLSNLDLLAIEKGIAQLTVFSLRVAREEYTEEQKANNVRLLEVMPSEELSRHFDEIRAKTARKIEPLLDALSKQFMIYQYKDKSISYSKDDWDLFFWCNSKAGEWDYSYVTLNPNRKRTAGQRNKDIEQILGYIKEIGFDGIDVTIQYTTEYDNEKVKMIALNHLVKIINKPIKMMGYEGKIKPVGDTRYGFFKKGARSKYYALSDMDILALAIN